MVVDATAVDASEIEGLAGLIVASPKGPLLLRVDSAKAARRGVRILRAVRFVEELLRMKL